ncbi:hypothetical protein O181_095777 [Austropuccinia psidii MF-1]|uniref:Chitin synthase export chaperone n=1 Tax=Austropuccinia psidii MF-1 TaxID=1389203 RepID=A0A9Q3J5G1_9BASI|nr:hypothetical protein [Austropuccinia psidii MF-1]
MVAFSYGEWDYICQVSPQSICNLFYRQLLIHPEHGVQSAPDPYLNLPDNSSQRDLLISKSGIGIRSNCSINRMGTLIDDGSRHSAGNIANILVCCLASLFVFHLAFRASRRKAAVGRIEVILFFSVYGLSLIFQLFDTGSIITQGSSAIVWLTSIRLSLIVILYACLIWIGFLGLQLIEDGTPASLLPLLFSCLILFIGSIYIFLDTGFGISNYFASQPASHLYSPWTFSLIILWPFIALSLFTVMTSIVSIQILSEIKPLKMLFGSILMLIIGTLFRWIISPSICRSSRSRVDGSFLATLFETFSIGLFYKLWTSLTEAEWEEFEGLNPQFDSNVLSGRYLEKGQPFLPDQNVEPGQTYNFRRDN